MLSVETAEEVRQEIVSILKMPNKPKNNISKAEKLTLQTHYGVTLIAPFLTVALNTSDCTGEFSPC
jgi:hypothetical protein